MQLIQTYLLVDATLTDMHAGSKQRLKYGYCNMPACLVKLLQT